MYRGSSYYFESCVKSDTADNSCDGIRNGDAVAGDIKVQFNNGKDFTFGNVQPGEKIPGHIKLIYNTGTAVTAVEKMFLF